MKKKFAAIVIGAGMSGSWVAKELCDKGVETLLLDRGPQVKHLSDYPTASYHPWEFPHRGRISDEERESNPIISQCYNYYEGSKHFFTKDSEHPYIQKKPFSWIRSYQIGGKSLVWARQVQRWSQHDFNGPEQDDFATPWPISYSDISPWYDKVEEFIGVSGEYDGLESLPDGKFLKSIGLSIIDKHIKNVIQENYIDRHLIYGRCAHLTEVKEIHKQQGRGKCANRLLCERGCPFGGYFSANSSTIPWALNTGNLTIRPDSIVKSIIYNDSLNKATGVIIIDKHSQEETKIEADAIFVNAGTINTNLILLNSTSNRFPMGLGNDNDLLGKYIAFHNYRARYVAKAPGFEAYIKDGKSPTNSYIPRYQNLKSKDRNYKRGFAIAIYTYRPYHEDTKLFGEALIDNFLVPGNYKPWVVDAMMMGETTPKESNKIFLHATEKDEYGIPQIVIDVDYDNNDLEMMENFYADMKELFDKAGFTEHQKIDTQQAPGLDVHHMGGVRMGNSSTNSLINKDNQLHLCKNVYITDGACMTSTGTQNPSLTFMALAARAANHAVKTIFKN